MILSGASGSLGQNREVLAELNGKILEMDKQGQESGCEWQSRERSECPSYSQKWQRSSLCGCGAKPNPFTQPKPLNTCTSTQNVSESQSAKTVQPAVLTLYSGRGGGGTQITYYFSVHYLCRAKAWTLGLCIGLSTLSSNPLTAPTPPVPLLSTIGSGLPLLMKNTSSSLVHFLICAPLVLLLLEGGRLHGRTCATLVIMRPSSSLTAHFAAQMSKVNSPWHVGTPSFSRDIFTDPLCQLELKHDCSSSPLWMDGW